MPVTHQSKVFGVKEIRISKLQTDPAGGTATYAPSVVVTGSQRLLLSGTIKVVYLRGDNQLLDSDAVLETMTAALDYSKLNLDAMSVFFSTGTVDTGTTPNQIATWGPMKNTDTLNYFRIDARAAGADPVAGDVWFPLYKCKLTAFPPIGLAEEDYQRSALTVTVVPRLADNNWIGPAVRETAAALLAQY
jgi:hypothetical protein